MNDELYQALMRTDATAVNIRVRPETPATIGAGVEPRGPEYKVAPGMFSIENPESFIYDLPPDKQSEARMALKYGGVALLEDWAKKNKYDVPAKGMVPERSPYGAIPGAASSFLGGMLGAPQAPIQGSSPTLNMVAGLAGEGAKYASLYRGLGQMGIKGGLADIAATSASAGMRAAATGELDPTSVGLEVGGGTFAGGLMRATASGLAEARAAAQSRAFNDAIMAKTAPPKVPPKIESVGKYGDVSTKTPEALASQNNLTYQGYTEGYKKVKGFHSFRDEATGGNISVHDLADLPKEIGRVRGAGIKPEAKVSAPLEGTTPAQGEALASFGYTPELANSLKKAWSGTVDKTVKVALDKMPSQIRKFVHGFWYGNAPTEVKQILKDARMGQFRGRAEARALGEEIGGIPEDFQYDFYNALDPTALEIVGRVPKEYEPILMRARTRIDQLGREAVDAGFLDEETFMENLGTYLGRYYRNIEVDKASPLSGIKRLFIRGDRFKRRTLDTVKKRIERELIRDPAYAVSNTIADITFDLETAKAFRNIAKNQEWVKPVESFFDSRAAESAGFSFVKPDKRYGDLAGKYVQKDIADEIFAIVHPTKGPVRDWTRDAYLKMLGLWKLGKTAWSPATHFRNIFSNVMLADFGAELSPTNVRVYGLGLRDYIKKTPYYKEAYDLGMFGTDWFGSEIGSVFTPQGIAKKSTIFDVLNDLRRDALSKAVRAPGNLYQAEEHWFKMAVYRHQRELGATPEQAAAHAQKYLFDYSDLSPTLKKVRDAWWGGPFLTFTAKSLPIVAESAVKRPWRFGKYLIGMKVLHEKSKAYLGISDEEWDKMENVLPEWRRTGFNVLLPARSTGGKPRILDLTWNLPFGQVIESPTAFQRIPVLNKIPAGVVDPFLLSNPVTNLGGALWANREMFTGKDVYNEQIDESLPGRFVPKALGGMATEKIASLAYQQAAPGFMLAAPDVYKSVTGGTDKYGAKLDPTTTILNKIFGIRVVDVDTELGVRISASKLKKRADEIKKRAISISAQRENGSMSKSEYDRQVRGLLDLVKQLEKDGAVLGESAEMIGSGPPIDTSGGYSNELIEALSR